MQIEAIPVHAVNAAPYNPRKDLSPADPEYATIKASLDEFGLVQPLVWNRRSGHLVSGHQRFKILAAGGANFVQVSVVDLDDAKEKALNLALNRVEGDWDTVLLTALLQELTVIPDLDLGPTGFTSDDLRKLLEEPMPLFLPDVAPSIETRDVTAADVDAAQARTDARFTTPRPLIAVRCPHCAQEFHIDGQ